MRGTFLGKLAIGGVLLAVCAGASACNPHGEETTASGSEYSGAFPSVDPDAASAASGEMALTPASESASASAS